MNNKIARIRCSTIPLFTIIRYFAVLAPVNSDTHHYSAGRGQGVGVIDHLAQRCGGHWGSNPVPFVWESNTLTTVILSLRLKPAPCTQPAHLRSSWSWSGLTFEGHMVLLIKGSSWHRGAPVPQTCLGLSLWGSTPFTSSYRLSFEPGFTGRPAVNVLHTWVGCGVIEKCAYCSHSFYMVPGGYEVNVFS